MQDTAFLVRGSKLSLRLLEEKDCPMIVKWRNNDRVRKNFIYREEFTIEGQMQWKEKMVDTGKVVQFIICENESGYRPIGSVYFKDIDMKEKCAEYGIFIGEDDCVEKGYGNETAVLATDYAGNVMGLKKLILRVFCFNTPAIKSYEHVGFVKCEELPQVQCSDGYKADMILMEKEFH